MEGENRRVKKYPWINTLIMEMEKFDFMHEYIHEPEIFNVESEKFKEFLIHSLANYHSDFHYLSFSKKENIDQELKKVLGILQIYHPQCDNNEKLFNNISETDLFKFWNKFFELFSMNLSQNVISKSTLVFESETSFFKGISNTLDYLNYDFLIINPKKVENINLDEEIQGWPTNVPTNVPTNIEGVNNESTVYDFEENPILDINIEKLTADLNLILNKQDKF
mgnify:CR=1 FL=1